MNSMLANLTMALDILNSLPSLSEERSMIQHNIENIDLQNVDSIQDLQINIFNLIEKILTHQNQIAKELSNTRHCINYQQGNNQ